MNITPNNTVSVPTNTLRVGDVIVVHGGIFKVFEVHVSESHDDNGPGGACHVNYCEFLGDAFPGAECSIPSYWRDGRPASRGRPANDNFWNQQGNGLARTTLVVDPSK